MNMSSLISLSGRYAIAVLTTYALASFFSTQSVAASLAAMGVAVSWAERLRMSLHDLLGMTGIFLPVIAAAFAIALPVATWLVRGRPAWRKPLYILAGAVALVAVHLALRAAFGITPVAGARSLIGMMSQALAGAIGGFVFAAVGRPNRP
jgi:hypothetical protein